MIAFRVARAFDAPIGAVLTGQPRPPRRFWNKATPGTGIDHLDRQIIAVTTLMRASLDKRMFDGMLRRAFPVMGDQMNLASVDVPAAASAAASRSP